MDAQELRNLQEAYLEVVENQQQLDEISDRKVKGMLRKRDAQDVDSGGISGAWMARRRAHQAAARRNERTGSNVRVDSDLAKEEYDLYDTILSHLLDEGYAETVESAEAIMVNMSEEWRQSIVEEILDEANRGDQYHTKGMSSGDAIAYKISRRNKLGGYNPDERGGSRQPTTGPSIDSPSGPIAGGTKSRRDLTTRYRGKRNRMALDPQSTTGRIAHTSGGPKGGTKDSEVVGTNKYLRKQNFKRNPPERTTSYYGN